MLDNVEQPCYPENDDQVTSSLVKNTNIIDHASLLATVSNLI